MIEFTLKRNRNGKKSRWSKKYPRKRILKRGTEKYNLREWFYDMFKEKENIDYRGGFYLSNGIINYKKKSKRLKGSYVPSPFTLSQLNIQNLPSKRSLYSICKKAEETHKKQLLGTFYISTGLYKSKKATVYVATRSDYKASYFYMKITEIAEIGLGVRFYVYRAQDGREYIDPKYITYSEYKWSSNRELPDYVFLTKEGD